MARAGHEPKDGGFPTTRWTLIDRVRQEDSQGNRPSLDELLRTYLPSLRVHLTIRRAGTPEEIDDLLQGFIASRILDSNLVAMAAPSRGKFRTLLLTSLDRYVIDQRRYASAQKRGGARELSLDEAASDVPSSSRSPAPSHEFDVAWVRRVLAESVDRLRLECEAQRRADLWLLFEARILRPALDGVEVVSYEQLVAELGYRSPSQAWNALVTVKRMFERSLRTVIRQYVGGDDEKLVDEELEDLRVLLAGVAG